MLLNAEAFRIKVDMLRSVDHSPIDIELLYCNDTWNNFYFHHKGSPSYQRISFHQSVWFPWTRDHRYKTYLWTQSRGSVFDKIKSSIFSVGLATLTLWQIHFYLSQSSIKLTYQRIGWKPVTFCRIKTIPRKVLLWTNNFFATIKVQYITRTEKLIFKNYLFKISWYHISV